jgi:NADPH:quinone reductase-like Zn-dependent oxidoreductase
VPPPGAGEVLVRLKAATLNYRDLLTVKGGYGSRQKFPLVPVSDLAGVVESIEPDVREFAPVHRVIGGFFEGLAVKRAKQKCALHWAPQWMAS